MVFGAGLTADRQVFMSAGQYLESEVSVVNIRLSVVLTYIRLRKHFPDVPFLFQTWNMDVSFPRLPEALVNDGSVGG